jgi:hypothetical protein
MAKINVITDPNTEMFLWDFPEEIEVNDLPAFNRELVTGALRDAVSRAGRGEVIHVWKTGHVGPTYGLTITAPAPDVTKAVDIILRWTGEGRNAYIALNPTTGRERKKEFTARFVANWVDIDCGIDSVDEALAFALSQPVKPSRVVMSGDGLHVHYYNPSANYEEWLSKQEGLYSVFKTFIRDTDRQLVTNSAALLKLPGTIASKKGEYGPRVVSVLHEGEPVDSVEMLRAFPWQPPSPTKATPALNVIETKQTIHEQAEEHINNGWLIRKGTGCTQDHECAFKFGRERAVWSLANSLASVGTPDAVIQRECERLNDECLEPPLGRDDQMQRQIDRGIEQGRDNYEGKEESADNAVRAVGAEIDTATFLGTVDDIWSFKDVKIEELSYSAPRGSLAATFGVLDIGRSTFQRNLAISQAVGRPYFPETISKGERAYRVLYVNTEGGIDGLMKKLNLMLNDLDEYEREIARENFKYIHMRDRQFWIGGVPLDITKDAHAKFFERLISDWGIDAWHIDTFPAMSPFKSEIDPGEWLRKTTVLENIAASTNSVGYYTLHAGKGNGVESEGRTGMDIHKARGTTANLQLAQAAYFLDGDPSGDAPIRLKVVKAKDEKPRVREIKHSSRGWLIDATDVDVAVSVESKILARASQSDNAPIRARILAYLKQRPDVNPTRAELAEAIGSNIATVTRTVGRMLGRTVREDGHGRIYRMAEAV